MPEDQMVIYLTFDDGPTPEITNWTLDLLKSYNAKATFFCIGNNVEQHPEIFQDILKEGHVTGNHTYNHPYGWRTGTEAYVAEVLKTEQVMSAKCGVWRAHTNNPPVPERHVRAGQQPTRVERARSGGSTTLPYRKGTFGRVSNLFRPPYGQIKPSQGKRLQALGYKIIMWDILAFDWKTAVSKEACAKNVISNAGPGSIVVFHDSAKAAPRMKYALTETLAHFSQQGYQFKSIEF
ncbi:polysaccharide deacetylase family protein [Gelidibacter salicanalis]|uniref:Polysaccharide deacetylase family protein n=2 Tax=Gelidibacter salicanalis TaxID=291193 RepID=A0A934KVQ8_9FLAO|nr:polysaccharide deacetylase family protein [Gelidibacter salicanalis]